MNFWVGVIFGAILAVVIPFHSGDTNNPNGERSGLLLRTDHRTGCQYIGTPLGGLTPRLFPDGSVVCDRDAAQ